LTINNKIVLTVPNLNRSISGVFFMNWPVPVSYEMPVPETALSYTDTLPDSYAFPPVIRNASEFFDNTIQALADIPEPIAEIVRPMGVAAGAGIAVAAIMGLPVIAGLGLGAAATLAASAAIGAVTGMATGHVINAADNAIHNHVGERGNFEDTSPIRDAILGASLGINISAMNMAHPAIETLSSAAMSKLPDIFARAPLLAEATTVGLDLALHSLLHIAIDLPIEMGNQMAQSVARGDSLEDVGRNIMTGLKGTPAPSLISSLAVEGVEHLVPGARPLTMAVLEGLEGAARQGNVTALQMENEAKGSKKQSETPAPSLASLFNQPVYASLAPFFAPVSEQPIPPKATPEEKTAEPLSQEIQGKAKNILAEARRFDDIFTTVTRQKRISPTGKAGKALVQAHNDMQQSVHGLQSVLTNNKRGEALSYLKEIELSLDKQAKIYSLPGYR
jgi:hypothetical protein